MIRLTSSLCQECYEEVAAIIVERDNQIVMDKRCPKHGPFSAVVEPDPSWFFLCQTLAAKNIYPAYLMDVTDRCNLNCRYCYHDNSGNDHDLDELVKDAEANKNLAPFGLIGGEPTLHPLLPAIYARLSRIGKTTILTNGVKLCEEDYFNELIKFGVVGSGNQLDIGLSFHKESKGKDIEFLRICRERKFTIPETFYVIDDLGQIDEALAIYMHFTDVIGSMRIKGASNIGVETKVKTKIYVSDILNYLKSRGRTDLITGTPWGNKVSFAVVRWENLNLLPCSWYQIDNVDLNDIKCGPYYKAKNGKIYNLVTAILVSDGFDKRKCANKKSN